MKIQHLLIMFAVFSMTVPSLVFAQDKAIEDRLSNGLKVLFLPIPDNEVAAMHYVIPGPVIRQDADNAGIEKLLLNSMIKGSVPYPKETMNRELDRMGASLGVHVGKDYSSFELLSIRPFFERALALFAAALHEPELAPEQVELIRRRQLAHIRAKMDDPDELLSLTLNETFYKGHPYHNDLDGTLASVTALKLEDLKRYHENLLRSADHVIIVVGNFQWPLLKAVLEATFGQTRRTRFTGMKLPEFQADTSSLARLDRPYPTKYILGKFAAPAPGSPDFAALRLGLKILSARLWEAVRTKQGLAYAVFSGLSLSLTNFGYLYVTTTDETTAMPLVFSEIRRLQSEPVQEEELRSLKSVYRTEYFMSRESNAHQADVLAFGEIYLGDFHRRNETLEKIQKVTSEDILKSAKRYIRQIRFAVVGPVKNLDPKVFDFDLYPTESGSTLPQPPKGETP